MTVSLGTWHSLTAVDGEWTVIAGVLVHFRSINSFMIIRWWCFCSVCCLKWLSYTLDQWYDTSSVNTFSKTCKRKRALFCLCKILTITRQSRSLRIQRLQIVSDHHINPSSCSCDRDSDSNMFLFLFLFGLALGAVSPSDVPQVKLQRGGCPMFWYSFNGRCYKYVSTHLAHIRNGMIGHVLKLIRLFVHPA